MTGAGLILSTAILEFFAKLTAELGVKTVLVSERRSASAAEKFHEEPVASVPPSDAGETVRFLARQRLHHLVDLARAKWAWLIAATYYHPVRGRSTSIESNQYPAAVGGQFTVADFALEDVPLQDEMGELAASDVRVQIVQGRAQECGNLLESIAAIENELHRNSHCHGFPTPPWEHEAIQIAWNSLMSEILGRRFAALPHLNSFCGFRNLWSFVDTPANGIHARVEDGGNVFAFGYIMEVAWHLHRTDEAAKEVYYSARRAGHVRPHQYALRKVAVHALKKIWHHLGDKLSRPIPASAKPSNKRLQPSALGAITKRRG